MNDYKELIAQLRNDVDVIDNIADAIEQLVNDRNASVDALKALSENIDLVPVVRCKDCRYNYEDFLGLVCVNCVNDVCVDCVVPDDFYYPYGERKGAV